MKEHLPMQKKSYDALILAGRREGEANPFSAYNVEHKAFLDMAGIPMIKRVVETLLQSNSFEAITLKVPQALHDEFASLFSDEPIVKLVLSEASPSQSIRQFLNAMNSERGVFVTSCDHPLMTTEMVQHFLEKVENTNPDVAAGCVSKTIFEHAYPEAKRTFIKLQDIQFSGANMFWFRAKRTDKLLAFWRRLEDNRKHPLKMASEIGILTALKYLTGFLTEENLMNNLSAKTGARGELVELPFAQAAIDVDKPSDVDLVRSILKNQS